MIRRWGWVVALCCLPALAHADDAQDIADVSLDDLLAVEVTSTSKVARALRDAPGVVTVITRDDILTSGARDFIDVLRMVPGFEFGVDVQGVVGLGFRGIWGHEGKILMMLDGIEMNERAYGTLQFGNHFDVASVERVEVIRGPGSVIYGGVAELAVINVITRRAKDLHGASATARYGQMAKTYARRTLSVSAGQVFDAERNISVDAHVFFGQGNRSDQRYTDIYGGSFMMTEGQVLQPAQLNLLGTVGDLSLRFIYDRYAVSSRDAYDEVEAETIPFKFISYGADARYAWHVNDIVTVTPHATFSQQEPWHATGAALLPTVYYYETKVQRYKGGITALLRPLEWLDLSVGAEAYHDRASTRVNDEGGLDAEPSTTTFNNIAGFAEALASTPFVDISAGARYEHHSQFGGSFVPRLALTKTWSGFHVKALASQAFRAPSFQNLELQANIQPERTTAFELEVGYKLGQHWFFAANVFDTTVRRPIIYFYDDVNDSDGYVNADQLGTSGGELVVQFKSGKAQVGLSYAYYVPRAFFFGANKNHVADYAVAGDEQALVGFAPHKGGASVRYEILRDFTASLTANVLSSRYGYTSVDDEGTPVIEKLPAVALVDVFLSYENLAWPGLSLGLGVFNLFHNKNHVFLQPYNSGHAPLPMGSRELVARLQYDVDFL